MKNLLATIVVSIFSGFVGAYLFTSQSWVLETPEETYAVPSQVAHYSEASVIKETSAFSDLPEEDFVVAANNSRSSVVFIKTLNELEYRRGGWLNWFF